MACLLTAGGLFLLPRNGQNPETRKTSFVFPEKTSPQQQRMEKLAELGKHSIPIGIPDPGGPPVPALVQERELIGTGWKSDPNPALQAFNEWTAHYLAADAKEKAGMEAGGIQAAAARREAMEKLIKENPRRALANAIPLAERAQLPAGVTDLLEQRVDGFGTLAKIYATALPGEAPIAPIDHAYVNGESYDAFRYGARENLPGLTDASLHGIALDGSLAVLDSPVRVLEPGEPLTGRLVNESCPISGTTVSTPGEGSVPPGTRTIFQIGNTLAAVCSPVHVNNIEAAVAEKEQQGKSTMDLVTSGQVHTLCMPKPKVWALGDSGAQGTFGTLNKQSVSKTTGGKNVIYIRVKASDGTYPDTGSTPLNRDGSETHLRNMTFVGSDCFDTRMRRHSYNKTWITKADITPIMTLPGTRSTYFHPVTSGNPPVTSNRYELDKLIDDAKALAKAQGYDLDSYKQLTFCAEYFDNGWIAVEYGPYILCNGHFGADAMAHEYGHIFGLPHANSWKCTDGNPFSPNRVHEEYGDAADPMGGGNSEFYTYNPYYQNLCNWLPDSSVQNISTSGTYRVYQHDGTDPDRTVALKVGRDQEFNYWLSIRGNSIPRTNFINGVSIHAVSAAKRSDTHLLDLNDPGNTHDDSPLAVGQSWYDSAADLTFKTIAVGGTHPMRYADVQITIGPKNTGGYRPVVSGGIYRLKNRATGLYLDVPSNSSANFTSLGVASASGTNSQNWGIWRNTDGTYSLNHSYTTKWMDVSGNSQDKDADIIQYEGNGTPAQKWHIAQTPDGYLTFMHTGTDSMVLDLDPYSYNIHQWQYSQGNSAQEWYPELVAIVPGTYRMTNRSSQGTALEVENGGTASFSALKLNPWSAASHQKWNLSDAGNGRSRFSPSHATGLAIDVSSAADSDGAVLWTYSWNGTSAQRFTYTRTDSHWVSLMPECSTTRVMGLRGDGNISGSNTGIELWQNYGLTNQQWRFIDAN